MFYHRSLITLLLILTITNLIAQTNQTTLNQTESENPPSGGRGAVPELGVVFRLEQDSLVYSAGFRTIGESVGRMLSPTLSEDQFQQNVIRIKNARCKVFLCNIFFPSTMKIAGPEVDGTRVLSYADTVLSRAQKAGLSFIVLGSGGSRRIPDGYDAQKAKNDFIQLCKKLAEVAAKYKIIIALEGLQSIETNFLNSVKAAGEIVRGVNHSNFRLNADIFHMMRENESPQSIIDYADVLSHCEIAEKQTRSFPGVMGDDFKPYFRALRKASYTGKIFIEGNTSDPVNDLPLSFNYLTRQLKEVYAE
jgi:sugar phosphate isomerase/epimerase